MKITALATAMAIGISVSAPVNAQCATSVPTTGLGLCIDFLVHSSAKLTAQTQALQAAGYSFMWGTSSFTDYVNQRFVIEQHSCNSPDLDQLYYRIAVVAHELGHGERGIQQDTSSREAFIESWCDNEGYAVINNILGRNEVQLCSAYAINIGIAADNPAQLDMLYAAGGNTLRTVGGAFCDNNTNSITGKSYREYYGDHYDEHY